MMKAIAQCKLNDKAEWRKIYGKELLQMTQPNKNYAKTN